MSHFIQTATRRLAAPGIVFWTMPYLMGILILGTISQKWLGLHGALETYFYSWFFMMGPVPLPGGQIAMGAIFINLLARFIVYSTWTWSRAGIHLAHFGIILLFIGGIISGIARHDTVIPIQEGQKTTATQSYDQSVMTVARNEKTVFVKNMRDLSDGPLMIPGLDDPIQILKTCLNCGIILRDQSKADGWQGPAAKMQLKSKPLALDPEADLPGYAFQIKGQKHLTFLSFPRPPEIDIDGQMYRFNVVRQSFPLPFTLKLKDFEKTVYPGTNQPQSYYSDVEIIDGDKQFPARISMNNPLSYKGYTFYQSSFRPGKDGEETSILAVVHNTARWFPYLAGIVTAIGLLMHILLRRSAAGQKMRLKFGACVLACLLFNPATADAVETGSEFARLPVLHDGRIKPIDSFAEINFKIFGGAPEIDRSAALAEMLFTPARAMDRMVFQIKNPEVLRAFGLNADPSQPLTFHDIQPGLKKTATRLDDILKKQTNGQELSRFEKDLIDINSAAAYYLQILRSFSYILPLEGEKTRPLNYTDLLKDSLPLRRALDNARKAHGDNLEAFSDDQKQIAYKNYQLDLIGSHGRQNVYFRVIPVANDTVGFIAPWQVITGGLGTPDTHRFMTLWQNLADSYRNDNQTRWDKTVTALKTAYAETMPAWRLPVEYYYNKIAPFHLAAGLAALAAIFFTIAAIQEKRGLTKIAAYTAYSVFTFLFIGIIVRVGLLARPPIGTLYESVLFVSLIVTTGLLVCSRSVKSAGLQAMGYALISLMLIFAQSLSPLRDDMRMLDAVLNTNFWLATHVVIITTGYGWCFLTALIAHIKLIGKIQSPHTKINRDYIQPVHIHALISLFLIVTGTILGGIWADMSWGRFWGWDPKENGALLIALWLIWLIHGRLSRHVSPLYYLAGMAYLSVIVMLSWFGVNLLSVGLHSYGFISGVASALGIFVTLQTAIIIIILNIIHRRHSQDK